MRKLLLWGLGLCAVIAGGLSALASRHPDGLEYVAEHLGFATATSEHHGSESPLADYAVRGLGDGPLSGGLAGLIGIAVVAVVGFGLMRLLKPPQPKVDRTGATGAIGSQGSTEAASAAPVTH